MMHSARLSRSDRLQRVAGLLGDGLPHTTLDIILRAGVCAVNSIISELRANGMKIICKREGKDVWAYQLLKRDAA